MIASARGTDTSQEPMNERDVLSRRVKRHATFWVYMVRCGDDTYYTGYTNDLQSRVQLHNSGNGAKYLRGKGPVAVVYAKGYRYYKNALRAERYLKTRTRREKEELIHAYQAQQRKM